MEFPKKYNYIEREKFWREYWEKRNIYAYDENSTKPVYSVDTPPPYVSASHLHAGHIMSYSQAEFVVRYKRMKGFNVFYPMGFDDNGLPTERYVEKKYKINKDVTKRKDFVKLCLKETRLGKKTYEKLWKDLGISVDWTKTYSTINDTCQAVSQKSFINLAKTGKAYKKSEPILWCTTCQTALAQADLEDEEQDTYLNYIEFDVEGQKVTVATTRPELLPACVALFANPDDERYKGLQGKKATVPIFNYLVPVFFDEDVSIEYGTGLMMVCSYGDTEDIERIRKYKLEKRPVIDVRGDFTESAGEYSGLDAKTVRLKIVKDLKGLGALVKSEKIKNIVNVHERCATPIEFIESAQWFIDVLSIKTELLDLGKKLKWYPKHMKKLYDSWVNGLKWDWCISRQRYFGVPIPAWVCADCGEVILAREDDLPVDPTTDACPVDKCPQCGSTDIIAESDVLDTWATSSCTPLIISELVKNPENKSKIYPVSLRPQGFDIIRTWLFYSIVQAYYSSGKIPFKDVMISGHGVDEKGRKISKRLGNYIKPEILLKEYGADAIRYWTTGATLGSNHRFDPKEIEKGKYTVNKLYNASRFVSLNLNNYKYASIDVKKLNIEDKWILSQLNTTIKRASNYFEKFEYSKARDVVDEYFWKDFCNYYLELVKHRSTEVVVKYTLYSALWGILRMYAPILPYITEEVYSLLFKENENYESIHLSSWPTPNKKIKFSNEERGLFNEFLLEVDNVRKERSDKKMRFSDTLTGYKISTKIDLRIFKDKLEKGLNCEIG